jgi:cobalt-zinc-cadmium efflux system outer membrane protein
MLAQPMTADLAVRVAMLKSPRIQQLYGELGLARADVMEVVQISNPRVDLSLFLLGGGSKLIFGIAEPLVDLLTLPAKSRLAHLDYERARYEVAAAILGISLDVEAAWYRYVGAEQVAEMRAAVAGGLDVSAELAQRFFDAGNITELQLNREKAAASQGRIEATRAAVASKMARLELNTIIGLTASDANWETKAVLSLPLAQRDDVAELQRMAQASSLELLAAKKGAEVAAGAARMTRQFRLLGETGIGYGGEREADHQFLHGPAIDIELPIFNQGGARVERSEARLMIARARLAVLALASGDAVALGAERVRVLGEVADLYRSALVPERQIVTRQSQLEQNFALIGEFEVLQAKTQEYDAYQGFLEAIRDYWLARVDLVRLVGSRLPSDAAARNDTPSVAEFLAPAAEPHHHHHHPDGPPPDSPTPMPASVPEHHHHGDSQ